MKSMSVPNELLDSREQRASGYVLFCAFTAILGGFNAGYNAGVPNISQGTIINCVPNSNSASYFPDCLPMTPWTWGFVVGIFAIGGLIGSTLAGSLTAQYGRKKTLFWNNILFLIGGLMLSMSTSIPIFTIGRVLVGVASGVVGVAVPAYLAEISTEKLRGSLGIGLELSQMLGIFVSQGLCIPFIGIPGWRWLMGGTIGPALLQLCLLPFCKETPRFLILKGDMARARASLERLRRGYHIEQEFQEMLDSQKVPTPSRASLYSRNSCASPVLPKDPMSPRSSTVKPLNIFQILRDNKLRKAALIGITLFAFQPLSGIIGIVYYSTSIFERVFGPQKAELVTVGIAAMNMMMTFISAMVIERAGRKTLLLISEVGMVIASIILVVSSLNSIDAAVVTGAIIFVGSFAIGLGPITVVMIPEMMPTSAVSAVVSMANNIGWICTFSVGLLTPVLNEKLNSYTFCIFLFINLLAILFTASLVPNIRH
ncbi:monosaccharide transporter [Basidiobolus meristosporus CBS 931.73]|uniref:Monosaccharide transporter n=1 Tax=Basidiobolus meristosporus CBS 931.73 TaxID=1314790 RepID=A0A1Y1Z1P3_9FUNG|nr:monosaccharide transporter [Basidiobolus meristosporus CBS 931.73]|eukprot:ORY04218.1 monosaccharide transporter [Basidiobolus meristosporus CBS 931.73]